MAAILHKTLKFLHSEDGPTAVEYALLLALILGGAIVTMATFGENVYSMYEYIANTVAGGEGG